MYTFNIIYFAFVIIYGLITAIKDYKTGLIRNRLIGIGLIASCLFNMYHLYNLELSVLQIALNGAFALFIGFFLYLLDIWPAGDGKLFVVFSLLLTPQNYSGLLSSFTILINTFVPLFFVLAALLLLRMGKRLLKDGLKYAFSPYRVFMVGIVLFGFVNYFTDLLTYFGLPGGYFVSIIVLFFGFELLKRLSFNSEYIFIGIAGLRAFTNFQGVFTLSYFSDFSFMLLIFLLFRFFFLYIGFHTYSEKVNIEDLKEGMRPAEGIVKLKDEGNFEKVDLLHNSMIDMMVDKKREYVHSTNSLTEDDVSQLRTMAEEGVMDIRDLSIHKSIPFAVYLFLGFLVTILVKGDLVQIILSI